MKCLINFTLYFDYYSLRFIFFFEILLRFFATTFDKSLIILLFGSYIYVQIKHSNDHLSFSSPHTPGTPSGVGVGVGVGVGGVGVNLGGVSVMGPGVSYVPTPVPPPAMQCYPQVAAVPYAMMAAAAAAAQQPPAYLPHPHPAVRTHLYSPLTLSVPLTMI